MTAPCTRFDQALRRGEPSADSLGELRAHASACSVCTEKLALWDGIEREAPALRRRWESPGLMTRFAAALEAEKARGPEAPADADRRSPSPGRFRWIPVAAAAALFVLSMVGLQVFQSGRGREPLAASNVSKEPLLTEDSLSDVETSEANYVRSIEKLSEIARPRIENPTTPLFVNYREKLLVLDSAIAEMRSQIASNRFNSQLRRELLAMYQEKQRTLQQLMKEEKS